MDAALLVLAAVVALVALDAIVRLVARRRPKRAVDPAITTSQRIVVDLSRRDREP
ncbi:MAG TPA: hypothetical protein VFQ53_03350 [Kofleriaceae bacterium]|nr:hypothetical protein [Kofleriaceae bacterium]